jgi:hypothetical protein
MRVHADRLDHLGRRARLATTVLAVLLVLLVLLARVVRRVLLGRKVRLALVADVQQGQRASRSLSIALVARSRL